MNSFVGFVLCFFWKDVTPPPLQKNASLSITTLPHLRRVHSRLGSNHSSWEAYNLASKFLLVNLGFFMCHIYSSEVCQLPFLQTEKKVPWNPQILGRKLEDARLTETRRRAPKKKSRG